MHKTGNSAKNRSKSWHKKDVPAFGHALIRGKEMSWAGTVRGKSSALHILERGHAAYATKDKTFNHSITNLPYLARTKQEVICCTGRCPAPRDSSGPATCIILVQSLLTANKKNRPLPGDDFRERENTAYILPVWLCLKQFPWLTPWQILRRKREQREMLLLPGCCSR